MNTTVPHFLDSPEVNVKSGWRNDRLAQPGKVSNTVLRNGVPRGQEDDKQYPDEKQNGAPRRPDKRAASDSAGHSSRFASLKRKLSRSQRTGGFLLDHSVGANRASAVPRPLADETFSKGEDKDGVPGQLPRIDPVFDHAESPVVGDKIPQQEESNQNANGSASTGARDSTQRKKRQLQTPPSTSPSSSRVAGSSPRSSPQQRNGGRMLQSSHEHLRPASANIDPSQLVRMALNLSESRRMHLDPGHLPSIPMPTDRRVVSAGAPPRRSPLTGSLTEQLQDGSRSSRLSSSGRLTPRSPQARLPSPSALSSSTNSAIVTTDQQPEYIFSPATLSRAQHAKTYLELSQEYRRLLKSLPPLRPRPSADAKQNPPLERPYNPLQYLRNRDIRSDKKASLDPRNNGWNDTSHVKMWIDAVEDEADQPGYVAEDVALLPQWSSGIAWSTNPDSEATKTGHSDHKKDHRLPRHDWSIDPSDLLADAYWLEQEDHKGLITARRGNVIFDTFHRPLRSRLANQRRQSQHPPADVETHDFGSPLSTQSTRSPTSPVSEETTDRETDVETDVPMTPGHSKASRVKRTLLRRKRAQTMSSDEISADEKRVRRSRERSRVTNHNIGPLEKHMQAMMDQDSQNESSTDFSPTSPRIADEGQRRAGFSEESAQALSNDLGSRGRQEHYLPQARSPSESPTTTPRISVENYDHERDKNANGHASELARHSSAAERPKEVNHVLNRASRLGFFRRRKAKADRDADGAEPITPLVDGQSSYENGNDHAGSDTEGNGTASGRASLDLSPRKTDASASNDGRKGNAAPTSKRFFKGGRIGEIVRTEGVQAGGVVFKRQPPRNSVAPGTREASASDTEDANHIKMSPKKKPSQLLPPNPGRTRRSSSTSDIKALGKSQYHIKNLPSFLPSNSTTPSDRSPSISSGHDHISRQLRERRLQRKHSRFNKLAPPALETESDVSPTNSSPDLSRQQTRESYGFPARDDSAFGSVPGAQSSGKRLNALLSPPGTVGTGRRGVSSLAAYEPKRDPSAHPPGMGPHEWSTVEAKKKRQPLAISQQDVRLVCSQLLSSGVKARTIVRLADEPRKEPPAFLRNALVASGQSLSGIDSVSRREEHVVAAKALSSHLSSTLSAFDSSVIRFRSETCQGLNSRIDDLRDRASSTLMPKVRSVGDDADGFVARLTTTHTLAIKQVNDSVDLMMRKRRRRLRYLQRGVFSMLEWLLIAIMWLIWAFVLLLRLVRGTIWVMVWAVKWLVWI